MTPIELFMSEIFEGDVNILLLFLSAFAIFKKFKTL